MPINKWWPSRPRSLREEGYRRFMAKTMEKTIGGEDYVLQSVSPEWYLDNYDRFGRGKNTKRYADELIKNVVVSPPEIASRGIAYFNERDDVGAAMELVDEIENFLGRSDGSRKGKKTSGSPA